MQVRIKTSSFRNLKCFVIITSVKTVAIWVHLIDKHRSFWKIQWCHLSWRFYHNLRRSWWLSGWGHRLLFLHEVKINQISKSNRFRRIHTTFSHAFFSTFKLFSVSDKRLGIQAQTVSMDFKKVNGSSTLLIKCRLLNCHPLSKRVVFIKLRG